MIVVVGLAFEARIAAGPGMQVICSGDGRNLADSIERAVRGGCGGLISFGVAGGLRPDLSPGDVVIASEILDGKNRLPVDPCWSRNLMETIPNGIFGTLAGVPTPIATTEAKRKLHQQTGAVAVDMESHVVAALAAKHTIPMAAIRVITDPAIRALPKAALAAMRPDGTSDIYAMVRSLIQRPSELPAVLRTASDAWAARTSLQRGRQLLGPGLGLPNFRQLELDIA